MTVTQLDTPEYESHRHIVSCQSAINIVSSCSSATIPLKYIKQLHSADLIKLVIILFTLPNFTTEPPISPETAYSSEASLLQMSSIPLPSLLLP